MVPSQVYRSLLCLIDPVRVFCCKDFDLILTETRYPHRCMTAIIFVQTDEDGSQSLDYNRVIQSPGVVSRHACGVRKVNNFLRSLGSSAQTRTSTSISSPRFFLSKFAGTFWNAATTRTSDPTWLCQAGGRWRRRWLRRLEFNRAVVSTRILPTRSVFKFSIISDEPPEER